MRRRSGSIIALTAAILATILAAGVAPVAAVEPAGSAPGRFAWAVVLTPAVASYSPDADHARGLGGTTTVESTGTASSRITFAASPALSTTNGGVAHVTALAAERRVCWVVSWTTTVAGVEVNVTCADGAILETTPFIVTWTYHPSPYTVYDGFASGYAWMSLPKTSGTPNTGYQATSSGDPVTSVRTAEGQYTVTMPGVGAAEHVVVSSWDTSTPCRPTGWTRTGGTLQVTVLCRQLDGDKLDERFTILAGRNVSVGSPGNGWAAYAVVRSPTASRVRVKAADGFNNADLPIVVRRLGVGRWTVRFRGMVPGGAAIVSPLGGRATCQVASLPTTGTDLRVGVRCFTPDGMPANSRFVVSWGK